MKNTIKIGLASVLAIGCLTATNIIPENMVEQGMSEAQMIALEEARINEDKIRQQEKIKALMSCDTMFTDSITKYSEGQFSVAADMMSVYDSCMMKKEREAYQNMSMPAMPDDMPADMTGMIVPENTQPAN
jgi:uroporphyrinogen-III decarboxylase